MDWREVTIYTTTEGIGPVEALLEDNGVEGYVLEDAADFEESICRTATRVQSSTRISVPRWKISRRAMRSTPGADCVPKPR